MKKKNIDRMLVMKVILKFLVLIFVIFIVSVIIVNQTNEHISEKQFYKISQSKNLSNGTEFRMKVLIVEFIDKTSDLAYINPPFVISEDKWIYRVKDDTGSMMVNFSEAQKVDSEIDLVAKKEDGYADAVYILNSSRL